MKKHLFILLALLLSYSQALDAQTRTVTGTVTSGEDGISIPGANVVVHGATVGTITTDLYYDTYLYHNIVPVLCTST